MNETNKFKDSFGDYIQALEQEDGRIDFGVYGNPWITPDQAIEFAKQLTELAQEVKAKK